MVVTCDEDEPRNYQEAISFKASTQWIKGIENETKPMKTNKV